jgi:hypothetical protein
MSEIVEETGDEIVEEASAEAHNGNAVDTIPAGLAAVFGRSGKAGPKANPATVQEVLQGLNGPGSTYIVTPGHPAEDGTGGFNLRAAVAEALAVAPQWFTVREREFEGSWYWQVEYRTAPTKDRSKVRAVPAVEDAAPAEDVEDVEDDGADEDAE